ncbi:MAG: ketol-acid reductoisomerase [Phycisphaerales bacterium]
MSDRILSDRTHPELLSVEALRATTVVIMGYGNQGSAHAGNLKDAGVDVIIGQREESNGWKRADAAGFDVFPIKQAAARADFIVMALPDHVHGTVFEESIAPFLQPGTAIGFLHGYSIRFGLVKPQPGCGIVMVAPKGPGTLLRSLFLEGRGLPALLAVEQESSAGNARALAFAWAAGIGCGRAGIIETTFALEAESDLFGEQAVLCGGLSELIRSAFAVMIEAGIPAELAYLECCHEVKQIADLIYSRGLAGMFDAISTTARLGAMDAGPRVIDETTRNRMREVLRDIRNGSFAERVAHLDADKAHPFVDDAFEGAGATIRSLMPWLRA